MASRVVRFVAHHDALGAQDPVDQRRLPDIRAPDHRHRDRAGGVRRGLALRHHRGHGVQQVARPLPLLRGHGVDGIEAEAVEIGGKRRLTHGVHFVGNEEDRFRRADA